MENIIDYFEDDQIKHYNGQPVLVYKDLLRLHSLKNPMMLFKHRQHLLKEGTDFKRISLRAYRELYPEHSGGKTQGNPQTSVILFFKSGYEILTEAMQRDVDQKMRKIILRSYFPEEVENTISAPTPLAPVAPPVSDQSNVPTKDTLDILRALLDTIQEATERIQTLESDQASLVEEVETLKSEKLDYAKNTQTSLFDNEISPLKKSYQIATDMGIYSENHLPHSMVINAIATRLGYPVKRRAPFVSDFVEIKEERDELGRSVYNVYYTPEGEFKINEWYRANFKNVLFREYYSNNTAKARSGDLKYEGLKIGGVKYRCHFKD